MKKTLELLDKEDLKMIYKTIDYEHHMLELMDDEKTFAEKYSNWTIAHDAQLKKLYQQQISEGNPIAIGNAIPIWAHYMYAVWDLNFTTRTKADNEIDNLINSL